jgi:hypothetical protein
MKAGTTMSLFQSTKQFFSKHCETHEKHEDPLLRTHYYKTTKSNALTVIQETLTKLNGYKIMSVSKEHGEMSVQIPSPKSAFIVISVIPVRPLETAIDFSVSYEGVINLGNSRDIAIKLYSIFDQKLIHIGNSITVNRE